MCLIGNTDDVAAVGQQSDLFTELLNGRDIHTATWSIAKSICHIRTGFDTANIALVQEFLCRCKQFCRLRVQILTVNNDNDSRVIKGVRVTQGNHTGKKQHRVSLATSGRTKVCTALAVSGGTQMLFDIIKHLSGGKELRITANDGFTLLAVVGIEYEISQKLNDTVFGKGAGSHGEQRTDAVGHLIRVICLVPCVVISVWRKDAAHLGVGTIADNGKETVLHQFGDISIVANGDLLPSVVNGSIFVDGGLELPNGNRNAVDEHQ